MQLPPQSTSVPGQDTPHIPPTQTWPAPHTVPAFAPMQFPEAPQKALVVCGSMQLPPQLISLPGQVTTHVPPLQAWPPGHTTPHAPQLFPSVCSLTHVPAAPPSAFPASPGRQRVCPVGQTTLHDPPEHVDPAGQMLPQPPQLEGSTCSSTHAPPQAVVPPPQIVKHAPAEQTSPSGHVVPHVPQLFGSVWVLAQMVPQSVVPPLHTMPHVPVEHTLPAGHGLLHFPQLSGSFERFTQAPLHETVPPVQVSP
jgi:hypothetical protein